MANDFEDGVYEDSRNVTDSYESDTPLRLVEKDYSEESRTYRVSSNNKAFQAHKVGYSIFADCLDGTDTCVRLERYMALEDGGNNGWKVARCYIEIDNLVGNKLAHKQ